MATAQDVAAYILEKRGLTEAMKLHKLVYYAKAWSLVWDEDPLFGERIEAWANGPVCRSLYATYHREYLIAKPVAGSSASLSRDQKMTIDAVLDAYGDKSAIELSELTHRESPWRDARAGLADGERSQNAITDHAIKTFYASLLESTDSEPV
ncbi:Panacea domain-containing protein [Leifsonia sp. NPDC056665]|uniref:Panacea domain-containing protein n=1 Tax=Leifsonia sp. NPDC056665 TaxID=3345901 RepID=UPI0036A64E70